ncbi:hypothetical protein DICPUDRAFT_155466 [Dictyostelium purpureum]|uniref:Chromo domain-containing protein n=1 Tax=Dictyostelium purpureum TaxID=5786 RepID=F0ZU33_DICPU|nr:uncharacterized protein DICPUDRAFT_155466 [Dictyostelium purpureum]EGC32550.1 hypothetical protein DICPUDRAFT_155466 [Dictyostelium purpureum]|eukprot:XP_003290926.1 hypothetical protein DICPUDRAFT_155466 [Dictyostelium purpureum]
MINLALIIVRLLPVSGRDTEKLYVEANKNLLTRKKKNNYKPLVDEIEKIIKRRIRKYGKGERIEYLIRYKNSNEDNDTWLPNFYLEDECEDMVNSFEAHYRDVGQSIQV